VLLEVVTFGAVQARIQMCIGPASRQDLKNVSDMVFKASSSDGGQSFLIECRVDRTPIGLFFLGVAGMAIEGKRVALRVFAPP
jgi:hypothetical protein